MTLTQAVQLAIVGLIVGCAYSMAALGFAFTYRVTRFVNFAQGHLLMMGGAVTIALTEGGAPILIAILGAALFGGFIGLITDLVVVRPIARYGLHSVGIATLAVAFMLEGLAAKLIGRDPRFLDSFSGGRVTTVGGVRIQWDGALLVVVTVLLFALLGFYLRHSWGGKAMLMTAENKVGSLLQGVRTGRIEAAAFAISGFVAGLGGALFAPMYSTTYNGGLTLAVAAFAAATLGGLGSLAGALLGGVLVGVVSAFASYWYGGEAGQLSTVVLLVAILSFRPSGLFGLRTGRVDWRA
ncbi:MAG: branched-chain amino acid transport system permease protein [Acidimicrobiaceae bacterium]|jgi:branched-subunit amino acid ABC-type transport system permease component